MIINLHAEMMRRAGMIATSPSWRRHWLPTRWRLYPFIRRAK